MRDPENRDIGEKLEGLEMLGWLKKRFERGLWLYQKLEIRRKIEMRNEWRFFESLLNTVGKIEFSRTMSNNGTGERESFQINLISDFSISFQGETLQGALEQMNQFLNKGIYKLMLFAENKELRNRAKENPFTVVNEEEGK